MGGLQELWLPPLSWTSPVFTSLQLVDALMLVRDFALGCSDSFKNCQQQSVL